MTSPAQRRHTGRSSAGRSGPPTERANGKRRWMVAAVVVVAVIVVASTFLVRLSTAGDTPDPSVGSQLGIQVSRPGGGEVGDQAPEFIAATTDGEQFALPAGKPTVLFFMAGWCATCYPEAQALARIDSQYAGRVAILAVSPDPSDSLSAIRKFADQTGARYGFAHDSDGALAGPLGVRSLDTTVVVDAGGRVMYRDGYPTDEATLLTALKKAGLA